MSQAPRQSRVLHPIGAAAGRRRAGRQRAHTGPGAPARGRLLPCEAGAPAFGLAGALSAVWAAIPAAKAGGRSVRGCCDSSADGQFSSLRAEASLGVRGVSTSP